MRLFINVMISGTYQLLGARISALSFDILWLDDFKYDPNIETMTTQDPLKLAFNKAILHPKRYMQREKSKFIIKSVSKRYSAIARYTAQ